MATGVAAYSQECRDPRICTSRIVGKPYLTGFRKVCPSAVASMPEVTYRSHVPPSLWRCGCSQNVI